MDKKPQQKTILIAPLDWGLGHAARCIPIIKELQSYHINIIIAAEGPVKSMLKQEFPQLMFTDLSGYKIKYSSDKQWFHIRLLFQFPGITITMIREHYWLKKIVKKYSIDAVISDNRFGLYHASIPSIYITHQLFIKTGNSVSQNVANKIHNHVIKKYTYCWVPDFEGTVNIAGLLSHPEEAPKNVKYIGCLSRFEKKITVQKEIDLLIILSGPEPQRTIFENILLSQINDYTGSILFIRGLPGIEQNKLKDIAIRKKNIVFKNHLPAQELSKAIQSSGVVISRSGYTTIMDLLKLDQKSILVPTPGQAEQEYLATFLSKQNIFFTVPQEGFFLQDAINKANKFVYKMPGHDMELYKMIIRQFVETL